MTTEPAGFAEWYKPAIWMDDVQLAMQRMHDLEVWRACLASQQSATDDVELLELFCKVYEGVVLPSDAYDVLLQRFSVRRK